MYFGIMLLMMWVVVCNMIMCWCIFMIEKIVFVSFDELGKFILYGYSEIIYDCDWMLIECIVIGMIWLF